MRIGMFTNNYRPRVSGPAVSIENLSGALRQLGHEVHIFAPKYPKATKSEGLVHRFPSLRWSGKLFQPMPFDLSFKINGLIERLGFDIIHTHHPFWLGQIALRYAQRLKVPLVFTQHAFYHKYPQEFLGLPVEPLEKIIVRTRNAYLKKCAAIIAPSRAVKRELLTAHPPVAVSVIPSGIDLKKFAPDSRRRQIFRRQLGLKSNEVALLCVARLAFEKNVDFLLTALAPLLKARAGVKLFLVGDGLARPMLKNAARGLDIKGQVLFPGAVEYENLPDWYRAADVFVYPSLFETQGLALIEAMAAGLPVVARSSETTREILAQGSGLVVEPNNASAFAQTVTRALDDKALKRQLSQHTRRAARAYDLKNVARRHATLYCTKNLLKVSRLKKFA